MSDARPVFEKKELALSSSPYVFLPVNVLCTDHVSFNGIIIVTSSSEMYRPYHGKEFIHYGFYPIYKILQSTILIFGHIAHKVI